MIMDKETIIKLAREADEYAYKVFPKLLPRPITTHWRLVRDEHFAKLVAEHSASVEREACAKVCEAIRYEGYVPPEDGAAADYYDNASIDCAAAIRARGNT